MQFNICHRSVILSHIFISVKPYSNSSCKFNLNYNYKGGDMQNSIFKKLLFILLIVQGAWVAQHASYMFNFGNTYSTIISSLLILGYVVLFISIVGQLYLKKIFRIPLLLIVFTFMMINCLTQGSIFSGVQMFFVQLLCGLYGAVLTLSLWGKIDWK